MHAQLNSTSAFFKNELNNPIVLFTPSRHQLVKKIATKIKEKEFTNYIGIFCTCKIEIVKISKIFARCLRNKLKSGYGKDIYAL